MDGVYILPQCGVCRKSITEWKQHCVMSMISHFVGNPRLLFYGVRFFLGIQGVDVYSKVILIRIESLEF